MGRIGGSVGCGVVTRIDCGSVTLGYSEQGSGEPVLMIHGLGYARWGWTWQVPALSQRFRTITFDNRGIGESDTPEGPYTVAQMAGDTLGLLDALGVERAHVIGTSLGGFVAQHIAVHAPDRVARLVLACTASGGPDMVPMPEVTVRLIEEAPTLPDEVRLRRFIENGFTRAFADARPDVIERLMGFRRDTAQPLAAWMAQSAAGAAFDLAARAGDIVAETLVLTGVEDTVVDPKNSVVLADAIPGATLVEMPGGHLFFVEEADRFNDVVTRFLTEGGESVAGA